MTKTELLHKLKECKQTCDLDEWNACDDAFMRLVLHKDPLLIELLTAYMEADRAMDEAVERN